MNWGDLILRIRAMLHRSRAEDELEEELQFHIEMQAKKNQSAGNNPLEASRLARVHFGAMDKTKEECRDARGTRLIEDALADVRYALRGFRRTPVFVLTVVATIAFPLGLITALFTIFNAYVHRPVAVRDPQASINSPGRIDVEPDTPSHGRNSRPFEMAIPRSSKSQARGLCSHG